MAWPVPDPLAPEFPASCVAFRLEAGVLVSLGLKLSAGGSISSFGFDPKTKPEPPKFGIFGAQDSPRRQPLDNAKVSPNPRAKTRYELKTGRSIPCIAVGLPGFASL